MKTIFFLICCTLIAGPAAPQQKELDSLLNVLKRHSANDTTRVNLLNDIAYAYCEIDPAKGMEAAEQAIILGGAIDYQKGLAKAYRYKGINCSRLGKDSAASVCYKKSLQMFERLNDKKGIATVLYSLGEISFNRGEYYNALDYLERSSLLVKQADKAFLKNIYNSTGTIYHSLSNYTKALEFYLKALTTAEALGDGVTAATVLGNIGILYGEINDDSKALQYHQRALELYEKAGNKNGVAAELEGIGNAWDNKNDSVKALSFYKKALAINESIDNKRDIANDLTNIGMVYYNRGNYAEALKYFPKAVMIYEEVDDTYNFATLLNAIGDTYAKAPAEVLRQYGIDPRDRYAKALEYNKRGLELAKQTGVLSNQEDMLTSISKIYEKQKDYFAALETYKQVIPLHDSILNNKKNEEITRQELQYEFGKKELLASAEIERQKTVKNASIAGGVILIIASLISFVFYKRKRDADLQKKEAEFKTMVGDVEMKALRSQMNPHFIFNSLHSINKYVVDNDKEKASAYLSKFSKLMRLILENSREQEVTLEKDLSALELYMQLEALRFHDKFQYKIEVDQEIDIENTLIPPMLLQPFVENSIIHGVSNKKDGLIKIRINKEDSVIRCIVEDNGIGREQSVVIDQGKEKKHESLGMKITQERLHIINQLKKVKTAINIFDLRDSNNNPGGLRIELSLPFEQAF